MTQNVCRYFKFGYCKFGDKCKNLHIEEKCGDKQCEIMNCDKRHPRPCNFYRDYGRCKYLEYCKYEHIQQGNNILTEKYQNKIDTLEKVVDEKDSLIRKLKIETEENKVRLDMLEKDVKIKENIMKEMLEKVNQISEKFATFERLGDEKIKALEVDIKVHSEKFTEHCLKVLAVKVDEICIGSGYNLIETEIIEFFQKEEHEDQGAGNEEHDDQGEEKEDREDQDDGKEEHEDQDTTNFMDKTFINPSLGYSCEKCDFVAKNAGGLKTHIKRKHKNYD